MEILHSCDALPADLRFVVTLGTFDGVHRGHRRVLAATVAEARARRATPVVITFEPHPAAVLRGQPPPLLCDPAERLALIAEAGPAITVVQPFDRHFAGQSPAAFLRRLASGRDLAGVVMTPESAFGQHRAGTLAEVERLATEIGFAVRAIEPLELAGGPVSSSRLRELLSAGRLAQARRLLGRHYAVIGEVVAGDRRGRQLGYPTANLRFERPVTLPPDGIYAARAGWGGGDPLRPSERADGVASLGVRPTFGGGERTLEVHLFDFNGDVYGQQLRLEFVRRQRGERHFGSSEALISQMDRDAARARAILGGRGA